MKFSWLIGGEAGFGIMTTGLVFSKIVNRLGYYSFDFIEYPSLIRGGHNAFEVTVSDNEVTGLKWEIDFLVCLNSDTFEKHKTRLSSNACIVYDPDDFDFNEPNYTKISIPFKRILANSKGQAVMKNTIALGGSLALLGCDFGVLDDIISEQFVKKGQEAVEYNKKFARTGFEHVKNEHLPKIKKLLVKRQGGKKLVLSGNDAFSLGAVIGDCRMYVAYPMTPSSSVLTTLASWQNKVGMVVRHAEDEISVINTALGASFAGVRSAVGTSGGGFALMVESISLAGVTETPLVIFLAQRPGPATGMPTWSEQGDLLFAVHAGHGEFPKIVLAPGDQVEMIKLSLKAFNLADIYQTPVIIMSDMFLSESHKSVEKDLIDNLISNYKINRGKLLKKDSKDSFQQPVVNSKENQSAVALNFPRYKITEDGISPRLLPGTPGYFYQINSYEHLEDGHTTEEAEARSSQVEKRNRKTATYLKSDFAIPSIFGDLEKSELVLISWGSTKGTILEAQNILKSQDINTAFIHFNHIYPLAKDKISALFKKNKRYLLVENNSQGQFGKLLQMEIGVQVKEKILKYDGRPFWPEQIAEQVNLLLD